MSYSLLAMYILIDELHHLARIETICLAEVNKESLIATLCLTRTTAAASSAFTSCATAVLTRTT